MNVREDKKTGCSILLTTDYEMKADLNGTKTRDPLVKNLKERRKGFGDTDTAIIGCLLRSMTRS